MTTETMTSRERILATVYGYEVDRFPVWLKMDNGTWQGSQPEPYRSMGSRELLTECGCDLMDWTGTGADQRNPHVTYRQERSNGTATDIFETPDGVLTKEYGVDPINGWHPTKYLVEAPEDLAALRWLYRDTTYELDGDVEPSRVKQAQCEADGVLTSTGLGPTPLMNLIEDIAGPENANYLAVDEPDLFDEVIDLMHADYLRHLDVYLPVQVADTCWLTENTSTTLISPTQFETICAPHLREYSQRIADAGMIPVFHMCGTLNAVLEQIDELPALVNEAYTTPPVGDTTLAEGRTRMPSKALWGGTNATLWMAPTETIVQTVADDLANCPDRRKIFLTSAGVLPPIVSFEKARATVEQLKQLKP
ncbi:MAG: uroporphyrinogen decarboxylase family protein [Planctomycetota bacterium]|jgi:uroporphyrinogen-III decarboxylase